MSSVGEATLVLVELTPHVNVHMHGQLFSNTRRQATVWGILPKGSGVLNGGFQIMSKPSKAQRRGKKAVKSTIGSTPGKKRACDLHP